MFKFHFYNEWKTASYITWLQTEFQDYRSIDCYFISFVIVIFNFTFLLKLKNNLRR